MVDPGKPYRPKLPERDWAAIEDVVHSMVARAAPLVTYSQAQLYPMIARLVHFAYIKHIPLEDSAILAPRTVERFVQLYLSAYNPASRNSMRSRVRRVSEALLGGDTASRYKALGKADASRPYTSSETSLLRAWARSMRTEELTSSAGALLALGFGAGLTGAEIIRQRVSHIDLDRNEVHVGGGEGRVVPISGDTWRTLLRVRASVTGGKGYAFRSHQGGENPNLVTDFASRTNPQVPLTTRRMRATWLVAHLDSGTRLKPLLAIAGLHSAEALDRILPFASA